MGPTPTTGKPDIRFSGLEARVIPVPADDVWATNEGKQFPYSFSYPKTLSLGVFTDDPFDGVTIFYGNTSPQENLFFRVENLTTINKKNTLENPWNTPKTGTKTTDGRGFHLSQLLPTAKSSKAIAPNI